MNSYISPPEQEIPVEQGFDERAQVARIMLLGHDLRAAVSDILGGLRLLSGQALPPETRLQLERMRAAGDDMARLIEEGFEIVAEQTVGPLRHTLQLARLLYDLEMRWAGRAQEKGLHFHVAMAPDVPLLVQLDRIALERALTNMLSNAVKYTDRGTIRLVITVEAAERLRFAVLDDGPGFDPQVRGQLFRPWSRGDVPGKAGHGLGLFIARDMARRLDADIEIFNRPEGGACVALLLPLAGLLPPEMRADAPLPDLSRMRVLIAEDSALNQAVLSHMIAAMGAHCDTAADGVEALQLLDNGSYDLAVIDIEMPRVSGLDLMQTLRASGGRHAEIPIVACTAYVLRTNREAICAAGADGIVSKPFSGIEPLAAAISRALARESTGRTARPPVLDSGTFEALLDVAGPEGAQELLERLIADLKSAERALVAGLSERATNPVRAQSHILVSVAGAVGAAGLQKLAEDLGQAAAAHDLPAMDILGRGTLSQTDRLINFAVKRLQAMSGANP